MKQYQMDNFQSILNIKGFNPQFGESLIKALEEEMINYKDFFKILSICIQQKSPIIALNPDIKNRLLSLSNSNNIDSLLMILLTYIFDKSQVDNDLMQKEFQNYIINNKNNLHIFLDTMSLNKLVASRSQKWFTIIEQWLVLLQGANEYIYCDLCESLMTPVFNKSDSYICSNPACENKVQKYHNHCWSCGSEIDSKYDSFCDNCEWYICSECGECRPAKFGGCNAQHAIGTISKYQNYSSLCDISTYIDEVFLNSINKFNKINKYHTNSKNINDITCNRGKKILSSDDDLIRYLALYLPYHTIKLDSALMHIDLKILTENSFNLWDWGCGQAIGSLVLCERILHSDYPLNIKKIVLIDPSKSAVNAGEVLLNFCINKQNKFPHIFKIVKEFDQLSDDDVHNVHEDVNFHIMSNILDIETFDLDSFIKLISINFTGINYFLCVGPKYNRSIERIDKFFNEMSKKFQVSLLSKDSDDLKAGVYNYLKKKITQKYITKYEIIFKTESTKERFNG